MPRHRRVISPPTPTKADARLRGCVAAALVGLCFAINAAAGIAGVDFGEVHWDEPMVLGNARYMLAVGEPLPRHYLHPTASVLLLAAVVPDLTVARMPSGPETADVRRPALLRARSVFSVMTATSIIAAALAAFARRRSHVEAVLAAAVVAGSFELSAHGRFIVPDGMLTAMTSWALCAALWSRHRPALLWAAAACAGIAVGTKYSGAIVILPALMAASFADTRRLRKVAGVVVVAALVFIATTPGLLVEPGLVVGAFRYQQQTYSNGFFGYSIDGAGRHALAIAQLLTTALPSHILAIALAWSAFVAFALLLELRRLRTGLDSSTAIIVVFAVAWIAVFAGHPAHFARNYLPLVTVMALLAAQGVLELMTQMAVRAARGVLVVCGLISGLGIYDVVSASRSINASEQHVIDLLEFVDLHSGEVFLTSPEVMSSLAQLDPHPRRNLMLPGAPSVAARLIAFPDEILPMTRWGGADTFLADEVFGPREINWNLYPTWAGAPRVVVMKVEKALGLGAALDFRIRREVPVPPPLPAGLIKPAPNATGPAK